MSPSRTSATEAIALDHLPASANLSLGALSVRAVDGPVQTSDTSASSHIPTRGVQGDKQIVPGSCGRSSVLPAAGPNSQSTQDPDANVDDSVPKKANKWLGHLQYSTLCWTVFLVGWNDGTTGPLLPRIQSNYSVGYTIVSLIFVLNFIGFVLGALANVYLFDRIGFGKAMVLGSVIQLAGYAVQSSGPPFPAFVVAFAVNGFGIALQDAGANGYVASLRDGSASKMGLLHAIYGTGAFLAPLSATQFARLPRWSFQYLVSLGIAFLNTIFISTVFRFKPQEECLAAAGQARTVTDATSSANTQENKYRQIFRLREVHYLAFFILIYVGVGVTIGGWSVTYIVNVRGGGPNSGYISSGFFGGVAVGRVALLWVTEKVGQRRAIFLYTSLAIALELVVWLVPSLIGGAVAVSLVGFLLGPLYPIVMNHAGRILPPRLLTGSVGWIAGFGQAGSAFIPLVTGVIASKEGIAALQPVMIAMMALMFVLWAIVPNTGRRFD